VGRTRAPTADAVPTHGIAVDIDIAAIYIDTTGAVVYQIARSVPPLLQITERIEVGGFFCILYQLALPASFITLCGILCCGSGASGFPRRVWWRSSL
jgi:hypothetical protein